MIKPYSQAHAIEKFPYVADASTAFTQGSIGYRDTSTGEIKEMTATVGDVTTIECIIGQTLTTPASNPIIEAYPLIDGMLVEADCTNNTAADQLNKAHLMTDARTVNNTNTHSTDVNAIFVALRIVGAASDKKLIGRIALKLGQVAA